MVSRRFVTLAGLALLLVASLACKTTHGEDPPMNPATFQNHFSDTVQSFRTEKGEIKVLFRLQAAEYALRPEGADFTESLELLAESWRGKTPMKVTVEGTRILRVEKKDP